MNKDSSGLLSVADTDARTPSQLAGSETIDVGSSGNSTIQGVNGLESGNLPTSDIPVKLTTLVDVGSTPESNDNAGLKSVGDFQS